MSEDLYASLNNKINKKSLEGAYKTVYDILKSEKGPELEPHPTLLKNEETVEDETSKEDNPVEETVVEEPTESETQLPE